MPCIMAASEGPHSWPQLHAGPLENGDSAHLTEVERRQRELQSKQQQLLREQRSADQERLLACITGTSAHPVCPQDTACSTDKPCQPTCTALAPKTPLLHKCDKERSSKRLQGDVL